MIQRSLTEFEVLVGQSDRTTRSIINYEWHLRQKSAHAYARAAHQKALHDQSKRAHIAHFGSHRRDKAAAYRLALLAEQDASITAEYTMMAGRFIRADTVFRAKMLDLAGVRPEHRHGSIVRIIDNAGSVEIWPGVDQITQKRLPRRMLRADGTLEYFHD